MLHNTAVKIILISASAVIYCEFINYYFVIGQCSWPKFKSENDEVNVNLVKALVLADTHLLGPYKGHWFDKLRREWQMYRAFQTAITIHQPEVVFILGDLFDEGQWCNEAQFQEYVSRFLSLFHVPDTIKLYVVPGNHDIGFHYAMHPQLVKRFEKMFNISSVQLINIKENQIILINSMALEGDKCFFCTHAEKAIKTIAAELRCTKENEFCKSNGKFQRYSKPIILQHFPMYRKSDSNCNEVDEAPAELKNDIFKEKWDCLSNTATEMIFNELDPRLIFTGHVHHGCHVLHRGYIHEYTLSSFSWRNKNNPTFILVKFTPDNFVLQKCVLPNESTVILMYTLVSATTVFWIAFISFKR
ncbi:hypothetical protein RUM44_012851 [Polyplax serrata]|uniref:Calcineurin-like phosphoesterase domain-containing protein n=1 Tax=Polyplax serrata TaxID=468196 RepID=A0ABR1BGN9_POLSC